MPDACEPTVGAKQHMMQIFLKVSPHIHAWYLCLCLQMAQTFATDNKHVLKPPPVRCCSLSGKQPE